MASDSEAKEVIGLLSSFSKEALPMLPSSKIESLARLVAGEGNEEEGVQLDLRDDFGTIGEVEEEGRMARDFPR